MLEPIVLYEIPGNPSPAAPTGSWNPNCWKTRYTLSIKALPYRTVWVEYPYIEALYKKVGAEAVEKRADGSPYYSLPAIYDPNTGKFVAESGTIARYIDAAYPETYISSPRRQTRCTLPSRMRTSMPVSAAHFLATWEAMYGSFDEFAPQGSEKRSKHWEGLREIYQTFAGWLKADGKKDKLFFMSEWISYADVSVAGFLWWMRRIFGEESGEWREIIAWDGGRWKRFMDAFAKYEAIDVGSEFKP